MADEPAFLEAIPHPDRVPFVEMIVGFGSRLREEGLPIGSGELLAYCGSMAWLERRSAP